MALAFPQLGSHCTLSSCKQLDFLPFTCDGCGLTFCESHWQGADHQCSQALIPEKTDSLATPCPICEAMIVAPHGVDINQRMSAHIESGCKANVSKPIQTFSCTAKGCHVKELIEMRCDQCQQLICIKHRAAAHHDCPSLRFAEQNRAIREAQQTARTQRQTGVYDRIASLLSSKPDSAAAKRVQRLRARKAAIGDSKIKMADRVFLECVFPMDSSQEPRMMFFAKNWTIGKILDKVAREGKIVNRNNQADAPKLSLIELKSGQPLRNGAKLASLVESGVLETGDTILLEYLENTSA